MPVKDKHVFIVVPARKNSKRLKNKNIKDFEGFPLFEWSLAAAIFVKKTLKSFGLLLKKNGAKIIDYKFNNLHYGALMVCFTLNKSNYNIIFL